MAARLFLCLTLILAIAAPAGAAETPAGQKAFLVTGASTGIGRAVTEHLAAAGHFVYAGARKESDLASLAKLDNVQAIRLDVTNPSDIEAAVLTITKGGRGLYGLVNNAGIATVAPVATASPEEFDLVMKVNVYGPYRVTQAFLPLIVAQKGRITNIGSLSGTLSRPGLSAYSMSKHAIEAFTDSLADELAPQGVVVNVVEPGNYDTEIGKNAVQRTGVESRLADRSRFRKPEEVADTVVQALLEPAPRRRYLIVPEQGEAEITIRTQIQELVQMNEGQRYTYDRDALVRMLDEALAGARQGTGPK